MKFSDYRIGVRFAFLIALVIAGFLAYGAWSFKTLNELKVNGPIYHRIVQQKDLVSDILPPPEYIVESYLVALQLANTADKSVQGRLVARLQKLRTEYDQRHEVWSKAGLPPETAEALLNASYGPAQEFYSLALDKLVPAVQGGDAAAVAVLLPRLDAAYEKQREAIDKVVDLANRQAEAGEADAARLISTSTLWMLAILLLSVAVVVIVAAAIARGVVTPLQQAVHTAQRVAAGDLSAQIEVTSKDETGQLLAALGEMNRQLAALVGRVRGATDSIASATDEIARGTLDLSSRAEEQASSLEETAASMEELTETVKRNAENAQEASRVAATASDVARRGGAAVSDVVSTMSSINESSRQIVEIISVIDGIAFQTNILALNAAVEAARAGEQGRGFAVVAAEVRSLAQRSAAAAKEIKALIGSSVERVDAGSRLVDRAGGTIQEVVDSVRQVTGLINEIAAASREQTRGIEQVNQAVTQMELVTQQNASLAEQSAAASNAMQEQAAELARSVAAFKLDAPSAPISFIPRATPVRRVPAEAGLLAAGNGSMQLH
jgi:methyl-accepting chemotaxis protein